MPVAAAVVGSAVIGAYSANKASKAQSKAAKDAAAASERSANASNELQRDMYEMQREDQAPWRDTGESALNRLSLLMGLDAEPSIPGGVLTYDEIYRQAYDDQRDLLSLRYTNRKGKVDTWGLDAAAKAAATNVAKQRFDEQQAKLAAMPDRSDDPNFGALAKNFSMADFEADPGYAFRQAEGQKAIERSAAARGGLMSGSALKGIERFGQDLASQEYGNAFNRFNINQDKLYNRLSGIAGTGQTANNAIGQAGQNYANASTSINQLNAANQGNALIAQGNARASGYMGIGNALQGMAGGFGGGFGGGGAGAGGGAPNASAGWGYGTNPGFSAGDWM